MIQLKAMKFTILVAATCSAFGVVAPSRLALAQPATETVSATETQPIQISSEADLAKFFA